MRLFITRTLISISFGLIFLLISADTHASTHKYAPQQLIIKFKPDQNPHKLKKLIKTRRDRAKSWIGRLQNLSEDIGYQVRKQKTPEQQMAEINTANKKAKVVKIKKLLHIPKEPTNDLSDIYFLSAKSDFSISELVSIFQNLSVVEYAQPNNIFKAQVIPDDTYFPEMWNLGKIEADRAWDLQTGSEQVIAAVVDTGVNYNHPDLPTDITNGYDFANDDEDSMDDYGHGTFIAGVIGAETNNSEGVSGLNWQINLLAVKVLGNDGLGTLDRVIQGLYYAVESGAKIINLSLVTDDPCQNLAPLQEVLDFSFQQGVVVTGAAGNDNQDASNSSPASCNHVIAVGATDILDQRATYSNYGQVIDLAAPGGDSADESQWIWSTFFNNNYARTYGTSISVPHVSGVVALMLAQNNSLSIQEIENILKNSADLIVTDQPIGGRLNAYRAVSAVAGPSASPSPTSSPLTSIPPQPTNIPSPSIIASATPTPSPLFTIADLQELLVNFLAIDDSGYYPVDNKLNMLDAGFVILHID